MVSSFSLSGPESLEPDTFLNPATRLGALFVVNSKTPGPHGLEFTKLTLWG